jgi:hypothetical protein
MATFRYLGMTANQILNNEEFKSRIYSGTACYHSVQNILFFRLMSKHRIIIIYKIIILPSVLYGYETSSLILREEY